MITKVMIVLRKWSAGRRGATRESGRGRVGRAILIHLTNSLSMRYTERLPCTAAARTCSTYPGGIPAILAGLHPCGLIYGRALTSLGPHQPRRGGDAGRCSSTRARWGHATVTRTQRGSWASLQIYLSEMTKEGNQERNLNSVQSSKLQCHFTKITWKMIELKPLIVRFNAVQMIEKRNIYLSLIIFIYVSS